MQREHPSHIIKTTPRKQQQQHKQNKVHNGVPIGHLLIVAPLKCLQSHQDNWTTILPDLSESPVAVSNCVAQTSEHSDFKETDLA